MRLHGVRIVVDDLAAARRFYLPETPSRFLARPIRPGCRPAESFRTDDLDYPQELTRSLEADPDFKAAFEALTPGRRRG